VLRVFLDTEFTDFIQCDLISIGLCAESGETFYGENLDFDQRLSSDFVKANVYPHLKASQFGKRRLELSARLWQWLDELPCDKVEVYVDYQTDWDLLLDLLEDEHPKLMPCVNVFNALAAPALVKSSLSGPGDFTRIYDEARKVFYAEFLQYFIDTKEPQHHALSDAKANCRGYFAALHHLQPPTY
jgi:hypothetical protein